AFSEWTDEGQMRQPVFMGLREDKDPRSVVKETFADVRLDDGEATISQKNEVDKYVVIDNRKIKLTNLDKVLWPEENYTKRDLIDYYRTVAKLMLPYLIDRPQSLYRTPNGIYAEGFYHKDVGDLAPDWATTKKIFSESNDKDINYLFCQDEATLVYMANLGCIEINPWLSRVQKLDYPDYVVIDLDPEDIAFDKVVEAALAVKEALGRAGVKGYPKTSGATGIHIYVPLHAEYDYDTATTFARLIATIAHELVPDYTSLVRSPSKRQKKVYLDYLQNRKGQTLAAPYSLRPRKGAPVSTPLKWEEVKPGLDPQAFTIRTIHDRVEKMGDLFRGVLGAGLDLGKCLERLEKG
ncbi:MAG: DNA ligase, partial [Geobacter sp.]